MNVKGADFLSGITTEDLRSTLPGFQFRRAVMVAHWRAPVSVVAKDEGVSVEKVRQDLVRAAGRMEREIRRVNL